MLETALLAEATRPAALALLQAQLKSSIFLLGNLAEFGPVLTDHLNSANFRVVLRDGIVAGVFALTRRGNLLVQTDRAADYGDVILAAIAQDPIPLTGFVGDWDLIDPLRTRLPHWAATYDNREPIFELHLAGRPVPVTSGARLLTAADFPAWYALRHAFNVEAGLPQQGTPEQQRTMFDGMVVRRRQWGVDLDGVLVALAAMNSDACGAGLVGGVYTAPSARRRGLSRAVMEQLAADARDVHGLDRLVLFTGDTNAAAQALYTSMGFVQDGLFGLIFGAERASNEPAPRPS